MQCKRSAAVQRGRKGEEKMKRRNALDDLLVKRTRETRERNIFRQKRCSDAKQIRLNSSRSFPIFSRRPCRSLCSSAQSKYDLQTQVSRYYFGTNLLFASKLRKSAKENFPCPFSADSLVARISVGLVHFPFVVCKFLSQSEQFEHRNRDLRDSRGGMFSFC